MKKIPYDGHIFNSSLEVKRYSEILKPNLLAGNIQDLKVHVVHVLQEGFRTLDGEWIRPITYESDFEYLEVATGLWIIEDVKGKTHYRTEKGVSKTKAWTHEDFDLKRKLLLKILAPNQRFRLIF